MKDDREQAPCKSSLDDDYPDSSNATHESLKINQVKGRTTEEKLVKVARATVMMVLFLSAVTVATLAYVLLSKSEHDNFKNQFEGTARQVILMTKRNIANVFIGFETLAAIYPTYAKRSNETMPFVTIDGFEAIVSGIRNVTKSSYMHYKPLLHTMDDVQKWNEYALRNTRWIEESRKGQEYPGQNVSSNFINFTFWMDSAGQPFPVNGTGPWAPNWQFSPIPATLKNIGFDAFVLPTVNASMTYVIATGEPSLTEPLPFLRKNYWYPPEIQGPISPLYYPVFDELPGIEGRKVSGILSAFLAWQYIFLNVLPHGQNNTLVVVQSCATSSTFLINGPDAIYVGDGDLHDPKFNGMKFTDYTIDERDAPKENSTLKVQCNHVVNIYPTAALEDTFKTDKPIQYVIVICAIFTFAALVFLLYDFFVTHRQHRTEKSADKSNAIVQDLFPGDMAARLYENNRTEQSGGKGVMLGNSGFGKVDRNTIAELHPESTVLFADISGFTAWSSMRDPYQVFTLLESVFQAFDAIAKRHGIFKVETVGDCYVAVCGVPKPNDLHAVVMCRFARSAMLKFRWVCRILELTLGPDTGDLSLRIGMHSGPVTAGVLRGDRARFQLFGDTVNTASRIESTGKRERVHLSEKTALQLIKHGKEDWIVRREDMIEAKGKGKLVTYWLKLSCNERGAGSVAASSELGDETKVAMVNSDLREWSIEMPTATKSDEAGQRIDRLVEWNCEIMLELLQRVVAQRVAVSASPVPPQHLTKMARSIGSETMVVEEVVEVIDMPEFIDAGSANEVQLDEVVVAQLRSFVTKIALMYNDNPFHNFEHASHVTMSINKLLSRIVAPQIDSMCPDTKQQAAFLHDHTCGITSDPLTQFAVVLSGLLHDLDHPGVSNAQLMQENPTLGTKYNGKSVAEQNSVDLAWTVLLGPEFGALCAAIFATETELRRFRHLLVNSIIATDIFDKDQGTLRKNRWNKAFYETTPDDSSQTVKSRKATIVIEHLIQASDVAHTMQHWHVYQKWNQRLFDEMMLAYRSGRSDKDPSFGWYGGELWFFDNYVLPLTKKLKDCGVFGVSSDEYLNYAMHNREEWEVKGQDVVQQYLVEFEMKYEDGGFLPPTTRLQL